MRIRPSALFLVLLVAVPACNAFDGEDEPSKGGPAAPKDGPSAEKGPPPAPPITGVPSKDELTEQFGVFVARSGSAGADGSRQKPFGSIGAGLQRAKETSKRLYVCAETFAEAVTIERGIPMVGGLDCSSLSWEKAAGTTTIQSPSSPAMRAANIDIPTRVEGFDVIAPDGTAASPSSIGLLATSAPGLTIADGKIRSGRGFDGAAGIAGVQLSFSQTTAALAGASDWGDSDAVGEFPRQRPTKVGGAGGTGTCLGAAGIAGGAGGTGGVSTDNYAGACRSQFCINPATLVWFQIQSAPPSSAGGAGFGAPAAIGTDGPSAIFPGVLSPDGFTPADGRAGSSGTAGRGGNGGGGAETPFRAPKWSSELGQGAMGSGGGAGGCPGMAGTAGKGGGASLAALVSASPGMTFDAVALVAGDGGKGGHGTLGSSATFGGAPAATSPGATPATAGQPGGRAGVSGSGAGGSSIGLAHTGPAPALVNGASARAGLAGSGVAAEQILDAVGNAKTLPPSVPGDSKDVAAF